jgi:hypothetical protein
MRELRHEQSGGSKAGQPLLRERLLDNHVGLLVIRIIHS